jgi:hypothetical protein
MLIHSLIRGKKEPKMLAIFVIFKQVPKVNNCPMANGPKLAQSGHSGGYPQLLSIS